VDRHHVSISTTSSPTAIARSENKLIYAPGPTSSTIRARAGCHQRKSREGAMGVATTAVTSRGDEARRYDVIIIEAGPEPTYSTSEGEVGSVRQPRSGAVEQ